MTQVMIKGFFYGGIKIDLFNLKECVEHVESYLENELNSFNEEVERKAAEYPAGEDSDIADFYEQFIDEHWKLSAMFPETLRNSLFITAYSLVEHKLNELCTIIQRQKNYNLGYKDLRGDGIERAQDYLKRVGNIPFPDTSVYWNNIKYYNKIRNYITHANGVIRQEDQVKQIQQYVTNNPDKIILEDIFPLDPREEANLTPEERRKWYGKRIKLERGFCLEVIKDIQGLFNELYKVISV